MNIKISYSEEEFNETVKFILKNNFFIDKNENLIRESILSSMKDLASHKDQDYISTMGFIIVVDDSEEESIDHDENIVYLKIFVDPALQYNTSGFPENKRKEFVINVLSSEYWKKIDE